MIRWISTIRSFCRYSIARGADRFLGGRSRRAETDLYLKAGFRVFMRTFRPSSWTAKFLPRSVFRTWSTCSASSTSRPTRSRLRNARGIANVAFLSPPPGRLPIPAASSPRFRHRPWPNRFNDASTEGSRANARNSGTFVQTKRSSSSPIRYLPGPSSGDACPSSCATWRSAGLGSYSSLSRWSDVGYPKATTGRRLARYGFAAAKGIA